jgi:hypothetical protein
VFPSAWCSSLATLFVEAAVFIIIKVPWEGTFSIIPFLFERAEELVVAFLVLLEADGAYWFGFLETMLRFSLGFSPWSYIWCGSSEAMIIFAFLIAIG